MQEVLAGGVIDDAPRVVFVLREVFMFLLSIAGVVVLIAFVVAGTLYLLSGGNSNFLEIAKRAFFSGVIGVVAILSVFILFYTIVNFLL
ncbi:MAG: hypothetical protein EOM19_08130 [Candidatus Moranbacteria bacterium]|nr:hypothetical protein [Candidatus Moranbacteria bacterium]